MLIQKKAHLHYTRKFTQHRLSVYRNVPRESGSKLINKLPRKIEKLDNPKKL